MYFKIRESEISLIYMKKKYSLISSGMFLSEIAYNLSNISNIASTHYTSRTIQKSVVLVEIDCE